MRVHRSPQPPPKHEMLAHERHARTFLKVGVVVAVLIVAGAVYMGIALSGSVSPSAPSRHARPATNAAAPWTIPGLAQAMNAPLTVTPPPQPSTTSGPAHAAATKVGSIPPQLAAAVSSCRTRWRLQSAAFSAADRSLAQWRRHLEIMNDLQAGRISLATAKAQWPYTTYQAADNVAVFRNRDAARAASSTTCAVDDSATGPAADALRVCAASMRTVDGALEKARVAIAPWDRHIKDQTHFAMGMMTPAAAEAAWRVMWQKGEATLPLYDREAADVRQASCSLAP